MVAALLTLFLIVTTLGCQEPPQKPRTEAINAESLLERIKVLASDEFEGRAPGSAGEEKTLAYLTDSFSSFGLAPGNPDRTYLQKVPLVGLIQPDPAPLIVTRGTETLTLEAVKDVSVVTKRVVEEIEAEAEIVFVGYGVVAPEYEWDDYKDVDVSGKLLLMLVNDPPGEDVFGGKAMTYYGRWTYKFEIGAWEVISGTSTKEEFDLASENQNADRLPVEGWIHVDATRKIVEMAELDFDELRETATTRSFQPVPLGVTAKVDIRNSIRTVDSANVVAKLEGSEAPDELVIYIAHWDHLGKDPSLEGDNTFNGAVDNASGTAGLLEIAEAFSRLDEPPGRSILFLAVTAEEQGLLGSRYYAENPLYPREKTVAVFNMDGLNVLSPTRDITVVGMGQSTLDALATRIAEEQGRVVKADPEPEKGFYYRSDHFEFAKVGIPAFYPDGGVEFINKPEGWGIEMREKYTNEDYHKPSDEVKDYWDLSGAVEDLELLYRMGHELATGSDWPEWSETSEFKARRADQPETP
jgi:Zn-dependent M28 family amino/carboxypeptidase